MSLQAMEEREATFMNPVGLSEILSPVPTKADIEIVQPNLLIWSGHAWSSSGGGGILAKNRTWMCPPNLENVTFSIPIFRPIIPTH